MKKPPKKKLSYPYPEYAPNTHGYEYFEDVCYDFGYGDDTNIRKKYTFEGNPSLDHYDEQLRRWTENDIGRDINEGHPTPVALVLFHRGDLVKTPEYYAIGEQYQLEYSSSSSPNVGIIIDIDQSESAALIINGEHGTRKWYKLWELELINRG